MRFLTALLVLFACAVPGSPGFADQNPADAPPPADAVKILKPDQDPEQRQSSTESSTTGEERLDGATDQPSQADPGELFVNANTSYEDGNAGRAVELYTLLLEQGYGSAELHYNLGNAYLRNGELGRAIAAYRRSGALRPRDEDVAANLSFARKSTKDAIAPPRPSAIAAALFFWHYSLGRGELAWIVLLLNVLFFTLLSVRLLSRSHEVLRWATMVVLLLLLATGISLAMRTFAPQKIAVIIPQEVGAHTGPDLDAVVRFKLHAGSELTVEDARDGWLRIRLPDGKQGWIQGDWADVVEM